MKKYELLVDLYKSEIQECQNLKAKMDEARDKCNEYSLTDHDSYDYQQAENLAKNWQAASKEYMQAMQSLTQEIDNEYSAVPYGKPAQRGIEMFWQLAGLNN